MAGFQDMSSCVEFFFTPSLCVPNFSNKNLQSLRTQFESLKLGVFQDLCTHAQHQHDMTPIQDELIHTRGI